MNVPSFSYFLVTFQVVKGGGGVAGLCNECKTYVSLFQDRSNAEVSCAGLFIGAQLSFDYPGVWVHVDMAYPVSVV